MKRNIDKDIHDYLLLELYHLYALLQRFLELESLQGDENGLRADLKRSLSSYGDETESSSSLDSKAESADIEKIVRLKKTLSQRYDYCLPLVRLRNTLTLNEIDEMRLILAVSPLIDPRFTELYRTINEDLAHHPLDPGFAPLLLGYDWPMRLVGLRDFGPDHPLRRFGILRVNDLTRQMEMDERLLHFFLGQNYYPLSIRSVMPISTVPVTSDVFDSWTHEVFTWLSQAKSGSGGIWVEASDRYMPDLTCQAAARAGLSSVTVSTALLSRTDDLPQALELILREAILLSAVVVVDIEAINPSECPPAFFENLTRMLMDFPMPFVICCGAQILPAPLEQLPMDRLWVSSFDESMREELWQTILEVPPTDTHELHMMAQTYSYDLRTSISIAQRTKQRVKNEAASSVSVLVEECRKEAGRYVKQLGQLVPSRYDLDDIILPLGTLTQLKELCSMAQMQNKVRTQWGLKEKLMPQPSITALFAGPSGTGKTMAADIIAGMLGRPLLRVDLAAVVSKYIGETEKNLEQVFRQAEESCSVLFFDEADALFGKRSEVKEAHDRYANIEISYLLQRMERYRGVAILATNLRQHLDDAFVRRLTMTVLFPFPSTEQRAQIWRRLLPTGAPIDKDIDWDALALRYKLSGGNIRNAIIAATFHAAGDGGMVANDSILHGIRREIQKMGKQMTVEEKI